MSARPVENPDLSKLRFDFSSPFANLGMPRAIFAGRSVSAFIVPFRLWQFAENRERKVSYGRELALAVLVSYRRFYMQDSPGELDEVIELWAPIPFARFIRLVRADALRGDEICDDVYDGFFGVIEDALNHAVTARGDPEKDAMFPALLDTFTDEVIEARLLSALSGNACKDLVFRRMA